jgi:hypothetical protein
MLRASINAFILIGICLAIHSSGIVALGVALVHRRHSIERRFGIVHTSVVVITIFSILMMLHLAENCIWAAFYSWHGLFHNFETSLYFSLATYTTIGYGDELLPERWRLLGSLQGIAGVLLCGLSTAFLFSVITVLFQSHVQHLDREAQLTNVESDTKRTGR